MGKPLNLKNPQTFSEKIQWLKLYDRNQMYTIMVDKYAVKDFVAEKIGRKYVIPTLGVWDRPEEINFDELPQQFVLKTTHGGGSEGVVVCDDKTSLKKERVIELLQQAFKEDIYKAFREWPYKNVHRKIFAECYIGDKNQDMIDYKFYCFSGVPMFCQVIMGRHTKETIDFFDMEWCHQNFYGLNPKAMPAKTEPNKPLHFDKMKEIARQLSQGLIFSRIDLYDTINGPFFGEITLFPASGFGTFTPNKYNLILGEMIKLPN